MVLQGVQQQSISVDRTSNSLPQFAGGFYLALSLRSAHVLLASTGLGPCICLSQPSNGNHPMAFAGSGEKQKRLPSNSSEHIDPIQQLV